MLLDYENQMVIDVYNDSCLLVSGKGMGIDKIFYSFLKLYSVENVLVLVLNCTMEESKFYIEKLNGDSVLKSPTLISSDSLTKNHIKIYNKGGLIFLSSQILIVDYLLGRIPAQLVTGILVHKAHKVVESSQEAFVLRLFKENNGFGFVKAFSENCLSISTGFSQLDRIMMNLQVRNVYLWPRFSLDVITTLNNCKPNVEEFEIALSPPSVICQLALLEIIRQLLTDLKSQSPVLDADELTVENAITSMFDQMVHLYIDPIWNQISKESRRLIHEIKEMRRLVYFLTEQDPVNFYALLETMKANALSYKSNWITLKSTDSLFSGAKSRLCNDTSVNLKKLTNTKQLDIEIPPKWITLLECLESIKKSSSASSDRLVLIVTNKEVTAKLLIKLLKNGPQITLDKMASKHFIPKKKSDNIKYKGISKITATSLSSPLNKDKDRIVNSDSCLIISDRNVIIHYGFDGIGDYGSQSPKSRFHYIIRHYEPRNIILFDPRMSDIREIENYQAELMHIDETDIVNVFFLMYRDSIEEQRYLTVLRREKEAFQSLINAKANLLLPEFCYDNPQSPYGSSTRIGGEEIVANIIVDTREFRSALPSLLHRRGFKIEPLTINVGDYILAPHICVERKSVSDFIGSLNNGRLYNQCASMTRLYPLSILLIEFSPTSTAMYSKNTFSLFIGTNRISDTINSKDVLSKLALLTLHFPKLRILWSHSPYATAELFTDLKLGRPEPSAEKLPNVAGSAHADENKYNDDVIDALLRVPGISWKNHGTFLRRIHTLMDLLSFSEHQLTELLENKIDAHKIYSFFHGSKRPLLAKIDDEATRKNFKKPRFDLLKKK